MKCGSFGLANPSVLWEQKINDRVSSLFNAEYTYATGRYKFRYRRTLPDGSTAYDTTAVRQNGDIEIIAHRRWIFRNDAKRQMECQSLLL